MTKYTFEVASCGANQFCMACNKDTVNKCDLCFNWGFGDIGARALDTAAVPQDCKKPLTLIVSECQYYKGDMLSTATERTLESCWNCRHPMLKYEDATKIASCVKEAPISCGAIANCQTTICFEKDNALTVGCRLCEKNYSGAGFDTINSAGATSCVATNVISNCEVSWKPTGTTWKCYSCAADYAVSNSELTCMTFTSDPNCRVMDSTNTACWSCWHAYYWDNNTCKLAATLTKSMLAGLLGIGISV
jgi:hypothetical protein